MISRFLGVRDRDYACKTSSFCTWTSIGVGLILMVLLWIFVDPLLNVLGASDKTFGYTKTYFGFSTVFGLVFFSFH
ncbi:MAG: MATE family efflux transporter [Bilifractor sp.]